MTILYHCLIYRVYQRVGLKFVKRCYMIIFWGHFCLTIFWAVVMIGLSLKWNHKIKWSVSKFLIHHRSFLAKNLYPKKQILDNAIAPHCLLHSLLKIPYCTFDTNFSSFSKHTLRTLLGCQLNTKCKKCVKELHSLL